MIPATLFGAPLGYEPDTLAKWVAVLEGCWVDLAGRQPAALPGDLELLRPFYSAGANARVLRAKLTALPARTPAIDLPAELALEFDGRRLITPEGRVLLDVLVDLQARGAWVVTESQALWAHAAALEARSRWGREWAEKQVVGNLSPAALGAACFLLVNGSIGPKQALRLPADDAEDRLLASAVLPVIGVFGKRLGGEAPAPDTALRSHWVFTQVSRLLPFDVARDRVPGGTAVYVRADRESALIGNLKDRLGRFGASAADAALLGLVTEYRDRRGALIALDQSFEEPRHTQAVLASLSVRI